MKHFHFLPAFFVSAAVCGCAVFSTGNHAVQRKTFPDNAFSGIPQTYFAECANGGTIEKFTYKTRDNQTAGSPEFEKYALVYLPNGYNADDKSQKYDVLYLMHGGADSPEWYFGGEGRNTLLKNVIDHMIAEGKTKPLIICAVSFYTQYSNDTMKNCIDFHYELDKDIIPVFEKKYHTFAANTTQAELNATRGHRAFGGFSMGGCTTWSVFEHCLHEMAYFIPMSGDCWATNTKTNTATHQVDGSALPTLESLRLKAADNARYLVKTLPEKGYTAADFKIYSGCGRNDIAQKNLSALVDELKNHPEIFRYCDNFANGNLYQCIHEQGGHDMNTVMHVMYNGLPKMFD